MGKTIQFIAEQNRLLLKYVPSETPDFVSHEIKTEGQVTIRKTFSFKKEDLIENLNSDEFEEFEYTFLFGIAEGLYFRINHQILNLKHDLLLAKDLTLSDKTFIAIRDISIFRKIDNLIDEPIIIGGNAKEAIPAEIFDELLRNFPTTTELNHYANSRITRVLQDYLGTMSDAQTKLNNYLNKKKTIPPRSKINFIKDYELKKFEYIRDELLAMLQDIEETPNAYKEQDWQRQIAEFILLISPKYISILEEVQIKDFSPKENTHAKKRRIDLMLIDANGTVDIIEIKRPEPHQLLSKKPGSRDNYTPNNKLSEAVMQVEKYLFHLSKWGHTGEQTIQKKYKSKLPDNLKIRITNPKAILILGRDKDFTVDQQFDFEIIKRKYANIVDIITYDDLLRRLDNIIKMIHSNCQN